MQQILQPSFAPHIPWLVAGMTLRALSLPEEEPFALARRLPEITGLQGASVCVGQQVHGAQVAWATEKERARPFTCFPASDGILTDQAHCLIGVFTADCLPVILVAPEKRLLAVIHAGRESTRMRIVSHAAKQLTALGADPHRMLAWIAPGVCPEHYPVSAEIARGFTRDLKAPELATGPEKRCLNLKKANQLQLLEAGLDANHIECSDDCTVEEASRFYSYRREGKSTGRMLTFVARREIRND